MAAQTTQTRLLSTAILAATLALHGCGGGAAGESSDNGSVSVQGTSSSEAEDTSSASDSSSQTSTQTDATNTTTTDDNTVDNSQASSGSSTQTQQDTQQTDQQDQVQNDSQDASQENSVELDIAISLQPVSQSADKGGDVTLNVSASGSGALNYQWRKDGAIIADAVQSYLSLSNLDDNDAGVYDVIISNATGSVTSSGATLSLTVDRSVRLAWSAPSSREDGSALPQQDISAYRIYHTTEDGSWGASVEAQPDSTEYTFSELDSGVHYFAVTVVDTSGIESDFSNVMSKQIF
ncbi:protein containing Immunoglobulin I-set domain and fibronectin type III domain [Hahella chejuensis KCTC 2396]|uniref:Protein containing Immunoglobulin I-set domain and fibronectin type III domain n=1 Tax=Hahella chejuensis (strain KCTC 2396) TaxID=349521 RepID=Q2SLF0_HAHCH|nr:immunoglobulin domain-containing protein [Hahella chejuensis]ABC28524.1 protein containing Immunoglobulin I-set domain and fibronectin type III domain [Hahella chejuensis KCTC 2396]